jgi:hypothetical protein
MGYLEQPDLSVMAYLVHSRCPVHIIVECAVAVPGPFDVQTKPDRLSLALHRVKNFLKNIVGAGKSNAILEIEYS